MSEPVSVVPEPEEVPTDTTLVAQELPHEPISAEWTAPAALVLPPAPASAKPNPDEKKAREAAQAAYADLGREARQQLDAFVDRANRVTRDMLGAYSARTSEIVGRHDEGQSALDDVTGRAVGAIENAVAAAQFAFEATTIETRTAVNAAGARAYGLIKANEDTAAARIAAVVRRLVSGHLGAFNGTIAAVTAARDSAVRALRNWSSQRASNFPTDGPPMEAAQNETRQLNIPRWVDREVADVQKRVTEKTEGWAKKRDTTVCGLSCSYRSALEAHNTAINAQGRTSVGNALAAARRSLREQSARGREVIADLRRSFVQQVLVRAAGAKAALHGRARSALDAARAETRSAVAGVTSSARSTLPTFARSAGSLAQFLREAARKGAPSLRGMAETAPRGIRATMRRSGAQLDLRLEGNLRRLEAGLGKTAAAFGEQCTQQVVEWDTAAAEPREAAQGSLDQTLAGFQQSFGQLSGSVSQAAASWSRTLSKETARLIAEKSADAQQRLNALVHGPPQAAQPPQAPQGAAAAPSAGEAAAPAADCGGCESEGAAAAAPAGAAPGGNAPAGGQAPGGPAPVAQGRPSGAPPGPAAPGGSGSPPTDKGLKGEEEFEVAFLKKREEPATLWRDRLNDVGKSVQKSLDDRATAVQHAFEGGWFGTVDEEGVIAKLRGLTALKGRALDLDSYVRLSAGSTLDSHLQHYLESDSDDYKIASAYLRGNAREGARLELLDSVGFFNDQEQRIEDTLRALSPDDLRALCNEPDIRDKVRDALGGTDLQVFDALANGNHALADALRLRDRVDEARAENNSDAVHSAIEQYTRAPDENDWRSTQETSADERRAAVVKELGGIVPDSEVASAAPGGDAARLKPEERAVAYVTREVPIVVGHGEHAEVEMRAMTGANRDLAAALLLHGDRSVQARAARLGVEAQRSGDPTTANIDRALHDDRFAPTPDDATPSQREDAERRRREARDERQRVLLLATRYAPADARQGVRLPDDPEAVAQPDFRPTDEQVEAARRSLTTLFRGRYGDDDLGARAVAGLIADTRFDRPSAQTASLLMQHAMYSHAGTNEALMFQVTERMTRAEIEAMNSQFRRDTGKSLEAELGVYGEGGFFTELSGDDRLRMERAMLGVPMNDRDRLERAAFALAQQRRETGAFGAWLAEGTLAERVMRNTERRLEALAGGPLTVSQRGRIVSQLRNFDERGAYTGPSREEFTAVTNVAQAVADNYSARIDAFADVLTTGIAVIGAIVAAAITVVTGGAALPLIAAAVATGLASMAANYAIKGGRYGWEQAGIDLAMTAVQALTAGVGAQLGAAAQVASKGAAAASAASRSLSSLARMFTGNPVVDQVIIGLITGSISGAANVAVDERTWERSGGDAVSALFGGLLKGALAGGATAGVTNSIEALGRNGALISQRARELVAQGGTRAAVGRAGQVVGGLGRGINRGLGAATGGGALSSAGAIAGRGVTRGFIQGLGGIAGRGTELAYDKATGRHRGDFGNALEELSKAGLRSAVQGIGEGGAEAYGQGRRNQRLAAAADAINRARMNAGLDPITDRAALHNAAEDLLFLNQFGRAGGDRLGQAVNLDHVAAHGGLGPALAIVSPPAIVEDAMRSALMRHVDPARHADFADVPIRVLPEAEYRALTRSEQGPVVTIIEDGKPVVVVREGTPISRLADEGPHLTQARDTARRAQVARLDEATLSRWDSLDLDTQIDLYRTKIGLEVDAHQQIKSSLEAELAAARAKAAESEEALRIQAEINRNEVTLRNLRDRQAEVDRIGPERRAAIAAGKEDRPQYLEQPARLFSKDDSPEGRARPGVQDEDELQRRPHESADSWAERVARGRDFNEEVAARLADEGFVAQHEVRLVRPDEGGYRGSPRVDTYVRDVMIAEHKYTQLAGISEQAAIRYINELVEIYRPGALVELTGRGRKRNPVQGPLEELRGQPYLIVPEQHAPVPRAVLEHAERVGVIIRDIDGRIYSTERPDGQDGVPRMSARDPEAHADAMREALLRHVPPHQHADVGDVDIVVLPRGEYHRLTQSRRGPVVTLVLGDKVLVVVRDGTPVSRLADEGPHLSQAIEGPTRAQVRQLDEATLRQWHTLDLDTQMDLYRTKLALEVDAAERIVRSIESNPGPDRVQDQVDLRRALATLEALRGLQAQAAALTPERRAAIKAGTAARPDFLDQPARLFSKDPKTPSPSPPTEAERIEGRRTRAARKQAEKEERERLAQERAEEARRRAEQQRRIDARQEAVDQEVEARRSAVGKPDEEGGKTPQQDADERLGIVAQKLHADLDALATDVVEAVRGLGDTERILDHRDVVDSLRSHSREVTDASGNKAVKPPRYGELEGLIAESALEQNRLAVQQMREHIVASKPHAVIGVERGGAFLTDVLQFSGSAADFVTVPKASRNRRRPNLEAEIERRIANGETRFAIVDVYMGGKFAGELQRMIPDILQRHPDKALQIEVLWLRETMSYEGAVYRPSEALRRDGGAAFVGHYRVFNAKENPRERPSRITFRRASEDGPFIVIPPPRGTEGLGTARVVQFPVQMVLGDDMDLLLAGKLTELRIFNREGRIVQVLPAGTPDPRTGRPLSTREILVLLLQGVEFETGKIDDGGRP